MSGIAEVMLNLGYQVSGLRHPRQSQRPAAGEAGREDFHWPQAREHRGRRRARDLDRDQGRQPGGGRGARTGDPGGAPRGHAGRADPAEMDRRHRRHARQDDHDVDGCGPARRRRPRSQPSSTAASSMPMARTPSAAKGNGWWWRPTKATARSPSCAPPCASSPTSIPNTWTTMGRWRRCAAASTRSSRTFPFYGFAVLCADHPEVQALTSRMSDRRRITYGFNPQADIWAVNVRSEATGSTFDLVIRARGEADQARWVGPEDPDGRPPQRAELARRHCGGA